MTPSINRLILAQVIRTLNFAGPIFTLFLLAKGLSLQQVLMLSSIVLVSGMVFEIPTGVFADRFGRKWSLVLGSLVSTVGWGIWLSTDSFIGFAIVSVLFGLTNAFWSGADHALIYDELKSIGREDEAQKAFSRYSGALALSFAVAAFVGGFLLQTQTVQNYELLFQLTFLSSMIGMLVAFTIKEPLRTKLGEVIEHSEPSALRQFGVGMQLLRKNRRLLKITLFSTFTVSFALMDLYQVYFTHADVPASWYGFLLGLSSLLIALVKWYSYKLEDWFGVEMSMVLVSVIPAVLWIVMAFVLNPIAAALLFFCNDAIGNVREPILADYQNRHIEDQNRATVLSTISLITSGYMAIMLPVIGWVADRNLALSFVACGVLIMFGVAVFRIKNADVFVTTGKSNELL